MPWRFVGQGESTCFLHRSLSFRPESTISFVFNASATKHVESRRETSKDKGLSITFRTICSEYRGRRKREAGISIQVVHNSMPSHPLLRLRST